MDTSNPSVTPISLYPWKKDMLITLWFYTLILQIRKLIALINEGIPTLAMHKKLCTCITFMSLGYKGSNTNSMRVQKQNVMDK